MAGLTENTGVWECIGKLVKIPNRSWQDEIYTSSSYLSNNKENKQTNTVKAHY